MNSIAFELFVLALLILANGLFAMSEIAVVSARKTRLQQQAEEGDRRARVALDPVSYTHLRAHETPEHLVCRLLLEKKKKFNTN